MSDDQSMRDRPEPRTSAGSEGEEVRRDERDRTCLRCLTAFRSAWSGERVCKACKGSSQWRVGLN